MSFYFDDDDAIPQSTALISYDDLEDNPSTRLPICLCLDTSSSMNGAPIDELNKGIRLFYEAIMADETARYAADISIVTFGGCASVYQEFQTLSENQAYPLLSASGMTPMAEAVQKALDMLEERKKVYAEKGIEYFQPWIVLMTDGAPTSSSWDVDAAAKRCSDLVDSKKLVIFPIGIGSSANMQTLARFSPEWQPLRLQGLKFDQFFKWLSASVSRTSQSKPGEKIQLDTQAIKGWGSL